MDLMTRLLPHIAITGLTACAITQEGKVPGVVQINTTGIGQPALHAAFI